MNCKYCGAALPSRGGVCPNCGKMIPVSQMKEMKELLDPRLNAYYNKDTAYYKSSNNQNSDAKIGKAVLLIVAAIILVMIIIVVKGK